MQRTDYARLYKKINKIMGDKTPLRADCGLLCDKACCKGDNKTGMRLFPGEETVLEVIRDEGGEPIALCDGSCKREQRPLACKIFPFFPTVDERGRIFAEPDYRAARLCPIIEHMDEIVFDPAFFRAVKRVGKLLKKDAECLRFLRASTEEIDLYFEFLNK